MLGRIVYLNNRRGIFAIELENGSITICEHLDTCDLQKGQLVKGPLDSLGGETIYNIDLQEAVEVYIEWAELSHQDARRALARFS
ncbi:hypothetical protein D2H34_001995 [Vibrio fluvialis]|uniref:hypothetical protein n=1 Tax=Vibrio fluvialis TaxID=676 RepID=UPI001EEB5006|nr:hypothetical protein [Vibrio fluvialis]MCG6400183.1 hypothetical protein [Vibrio fluvialis]